jgi:hypothetical protein
LGFRQRVTFYLALSASGASGGQGAPELDKTRHWLQKKAGPPKRSAAEIAASLAERSTQLLQRIHRRLGRLDAAQLIHLLLRRVEGTSVSAWCPKKVSFLGSQTPFGPTSRRN